MRSDLAPLAAVMPAALLYYLGVRRHVGGRRARVDALLFAAGLGTLVVALAWPLAALDQKLFWAHMVQHVLILAVAPPLILLGRPWSTIPRALPVALRRRTARAVVGRSWMSPLIALAAFCGVLIAWHIPVLYDATLQSSVVHVLEHALFLATGLLFWSQLIDSPPFRSPLDPAKRALWAALGMAVGSAVGLALAFTSAPLYAGYADLPSRPGGISALADQHLAAGIMWVPGSIPFVAAFIVFICRWLDEAERTAREHSSRRLRDRRDPVVDAPAGDPARRLSLVACVAVVGREGQVSRARLAALSIALAALSGVGIALVAYLALGSAQGGLAVPRLHGQASWPAGERRAPTFELPDHNGSVVSLEKLQSRPVLLTFLDSRCVDQCPIAGRQLGTILRGMPPADRPTLVIVSVNPAGDTPASIRRAMAAWRLAGPYRWHWLRGTKGELAAVWRTYGIGVEPRTNMIAHALTLYLIDRRGFERTGYLFPFLPNFVALDLRSLARERV